MSDPLIYQTSDPEFADRAIKALQHAGVQCYRVGSGARDLNARIGHWTDSQISIYIRHEADYARANEILIQLGAVVDKPIRLPNRWIIAIIVAALLAIAYLLQSN